MANTNYLYKNLIDINKKYDSTSFVDIDFIELFNIKSIDTSNIKKIITTKYYGLALKYHPDKYANTKEESIEINNEIENIIEELYKKVDSKLIIN